MAISDLGMLGTGSSKTAATTLAVVNTLGTPIPAGTLIVITGCWDNIASVTAPTITCSTIGGATAIANHASALQSGVTTTAGSGVWHQCFRAVTTAAIATGGTIATLTSNQSAVARAAHAQGWKGMTSALRGTIATGTSTSGTPAVSQSGTAPITGDLVIGTASFENSANMSGDVDTLNGAWNPIVGTFTTGSTANTNVGTASQGKTVTSGGFQTFNPLNGVADTVACVFTLIPTQLVSTITDTFDTIGAQWAIWNSAGVTANGQVNLLPAPQSTTYRGMDYVATNVALRGSQIFIQVVNVGNQALASWESYPIILNVGTSSPVSTVQWYINSNYLYVLLGGSNVFSTAYDPVAHQFLSIRESGGTVYFETSPSGQPGTWVSQFTRLVTALPTYFDVDNCFIEVSAGTYAVEAGTTTALVLDNLNVVPTGPTNTATLNGSTPVLKGSVVELVSGTLNGKMPVLNGTVVSVFRWDADQSGQPNGTVITQANSVGGTNSVLIASQIQGSPTFANDNPFKGTLSAKAPATTGTKATIGTTWSGSPIAAVRFYVCFPAYVLPTTATQLMQWISNGANFVGLTATGKIYLVAASVTLKTSAASIVADTWYWITVYSINGTNGTLQWEWHLASDDSLIESYSSSSVNTGTTLSTSFAVGKVSAAGNLSSILIDHVEARIGGNATGLIGPYVPPNTGVLNGKVPVLTGTVREQTPPFLYNKLDSVSGGFSPSVIGPDVSVPGGNVIVTDGGHTGVSTTSNNLGPVDIEPTIPPTVAGISATMWFRYTGVIDEANMGTPLLLRDMYGTGWSILGVYPWVGRITMMTNAVSSVTFSLGTLSSELNNWHHYGISIDKAGNVDVYYDGVKQASTPADTWPTVSFTEFAWTNNNTDPAIFDEVRLYDRPISASEVARDKALFVPAAGILSGSTPVLTGTLNGTQKNLATLTGKLPSLSGLVLDQTVNVGVLISGTPSLTGGFIGTLLISGGLAGAVPLLTGSIAAVIPPVNITVDIGPTRSRAQTDIASTRVQWAIAASRSRAQTDVATTRAGSAAVANTRSRAQADVANTRSSTNIGPTRS